MHNSHFDYIVPFLPILVKRCDRLSKRYGSYPFSNDKSCKVCQVDEEDCSSPPLTDPHVRNSRIRLLVSWTRYVTRLGQPTPTLRKGITAQHVHIPLPGHATLLGTTVEPFPPNPPHFPAEAVKHVCITSKPIVSVMTIELESENSVLVPQTFLEQLRGS